MFYLFFRKEYQSNHTVSFVDKKEGDLRYSYNHIKDESYSILYRVLGLVLFRKNIEKNQVPEDIKEVLMPEYSTNFSMEFK